MTPLAIAQAAYERSMAEYEAWLRGPFREALTHALTLNSLADFAEFQASPRNPALDQGQSPARTA